jgi:hypothetical protein
MVGVLPDAVRIYRRGSISEGLHPTLMVPALEAAKVGNARPWSSYERHETSPPTTQLHHCVLEFAGRSATLQERAGHIDQHDPQEVGDVFRGPVRPSTSPRLRCLRQAPHVGRARTRDYGPRMTGWSATGV